jgi:hypothetical protein
MRSEGSHQARTSRKTRSAVAVLLAAGAVQFGLTWLGLPGWVCPVRAATGWPCPGCGLSRALVELVRGHLATAIALHPFAPVALGGALLAATMMALPSGPRQRALARLALADRRVRATWWLAAGLIAHWALEIAHVAGGRW